MFTSSKVIKIKNKLDSGSMKRRPSGGAIYREMYTVITSLAAMYRPIILHPSIFSCDRCGAELCVLYSSLRGNTGG